MARPRRPAIRLVRHTLSPWAAIRALVPSRAPRSAGDGPAVDEADARTLTRRALDDAGRRCPRDGAAMTLDEVFDLDPDGAVQGGPLRALVCPECGRVETLDDVVADLQARLAPLKRAEVTYLVAAAALVCVFGLLAARAGSLLTLLGGLAFGIMLTALAMTLRYRHWQITHRRLFEDYPPLRDWLRDEWR